MNINKSRLVVVNVIKNGDHILLGKKPVGQGPYPDTWHIPGGGVNLGQESCDDAIKREILEETGLTVNNLTKCYWDTDIEPDKHGELTYYIFLAYTSDYGGGDIMAGDDMSNLKWVKISELIKYNLNTPAKLLLKQLGLLLP